jgi:alkylation response protein AidB-like acyl-CoA dehydrogenase
LNLVQLELSEAQQALGSELRDYFAELVTPEVWGARAGSAPYREAVRRLGKDGWLGIGWPREYGGQNRTATEQLIFFDEASKARVPFPLVTVNTVGPTLMRYGTDEQKERFLPPILRGEIEFAIGYSEPTAGTDLASLRTKARRNGDHYVVDGQKAFTSGADYADYVWLACRTDPTSERHHGLSVVIVPTDSPGFSWTPIETIIERTTTFTYYDGVRVPVANRVGEENDGWRLITHQLTHERIMVGQASEVDRLLDEVISWARKARLSDGRRVIDQQWVQLHLARVASLVEYGRLANFRGVAQAEAGTLEPHTASAAKVFSSEMATPALQMLFEVIGQCGYLREGEPDSLLHLDVERAYRMALQAKSGGGTNEVQREMIAGFGMGMPRAPR